MFRTFPKMLKCFQNRSKQTVVKSAKSLKLENTLVSLKTQIPPKTVVKTQCHRNSINEIPSILEHSQLIKSAEFSMNTDVKCSIIEASSNELLYQIEVHNGLIPAYIVKNTTVQYHIFRQFWRFFSVQRQMALARSFIKPERVSCAGTKLKLRGSEKECF